MAEPEKVASSPPQLDKVGEYLVSENVVAGGRLKAFLPMWEKITDDTVILQAVQGYMIEFDFDNFPPAYSPGKLPYPYKRNSEESVKIDSEIRSLEHKHVIEKCSHEHGEFISRIFTRPKKNGSVRLILDLSDLNKSVKYQHFKMDNIHTAMTLLSHGYYLSSVDLRDAYYSIPIHPLSRKYLRFIWKGELWQFKALPNGLSSAPRLFTKVLKPVLAYLRMQGHTVLAYLDDMLIVGKDMLSAHTATQATITLLSELGFIIHSEKSVLHPAHELEFLGFHLDTDSMLISLPEGKCDDITVACTSLLGEPRPSIRMVAKVVGKLVAALPAAQFGPLHYRYLELDKIRALKRNAGHFDRRMTLSDKARAELKWWVSHVHSVSNCIYRPRAKIEIRSDASGQGWGATDLVRSAGGRWNAEELLRASSNEINYLEMLAASLGLKSLCSGLRDTNILLRLDNTTAVAYLNNMGGVKSKACNEMALQIWEWCSIRGIWITASHLAGCENTEADALSRKFNDNIEWMLDKSVFEHIVQSYGPLDIDLFASRLNTQLPIYISWMPDPGAYAVDAFTVDWGNFRIYAFPPFCLVSKCIQKIREDEATGILIVPNWPTQPWFPLLKNILCADPLVLSSREYLLTQPITGRPHPLKHLSLLCCRVGATTS